MSGSIDHAVVIQDSIIGPIAIDIDVDFKFNLGSGQGTSVLAIYEMLTQIIGGAHTAERAPARLGEVDHIYLTGDRAQAELGWVPEYGLQAGLEATVNRIRSQSRSL